MAAVELSALATVGRGVYGLAGPYVGLLYDCRKLVMGADRLAECGKGDFARLDFGVASGIGTRGTFGPLTVYADLVFTQGLRSLVQEDNITVYNRGTLLQIGLKHHRDQ